MQSNVSNSLMLALLAGLALVSVGLKAAAGPPDDGNGPPRSEVEVQLAKTLQAQGFSISRGPRKFQSTIIYAKRGNCVLSVRDARSGTEDATVFARDALGIGRVQYLYDGAITDAPPAVAAWLGRFENKVSDRLGLERRIPIPLAIATSPGCQGRDFGLRDFRVG